MSLLKKVLKKLVFSNLIIQIATKIINRYKHNQQTIINKAFTDSFIKEHGLQVIYGPFTGMKYPSKNAVGSAFIPKLIGTYEHELHHIIYDMRSRKKYKNIIDIGAAEGYYAVGMAMLFPEAEITTFETTEKGRVLMKKMLAINNINNTININAECTIDSLKETLDTTKGLIICDCEGYEETLLNPALLPNIQHKDILVELHDYANDRITISEVFLERFKNTHSFKFINIQNNKNFTRISSSSIPKYSFIELLNEGRKYSIGWAFFEVIV